MEITRLLRKHYFDIPAITVEPAEKGEENQNFFVTVGGSRYVLRLYSPVHSTTGPRSRWEIESELDFVDFVREQNVPTPRVMPSVKGEKVVKAQVDGMARYAVLFEFIGGNEAAAYNPENARSTAGLLQNMRRASLAYRHDRARKWPGNIVEVSLNFYQENCARTGKYQKALDEIFQSACEGYQMLQSEPLPRGIIHGDIKLSNLLFDQNQVKAVLDFDDYRETYLLEEITRTLLHDLDNPARNAIRSGYYSVFHEMLASDPTVSAAEMAQLKTFLRARLVYDQTTYIINENQRLVDEIFADKNIAEVI